MEIASHPAAVHRDCLMVMGGARIFDVECNVGAKPRAWGQKKIDTDERLKSKDTKMPMMKGSKESVIYLQRTYLYRPIYK